MLPTLRRSTYPKICHILPVNIVSSSEATTQSRTFVHVLVAIFIPKFKGDDDMAKRKKHPRLPNGYGQIRFLGKNRRNPYGVYPPAKEEYENGQMKPQKAICYVSG